MLTEGGVFCRLSSAIKIPAEIKRFSISLDTSERNKNVAHVDLEHRTRLSDRGKLMICDVATMCWPPN
jgi:hypothetical protein